jgi:carotenoid cleavage dioxygenase-like enzyme
MTISKRGLLAGLVAGAAGAALEPERVWAAEAADETWKLGLVDAAGDAPRTAMRLVRGRPPRDLKGVLYRNGPALWRRPGGDAEHWFDGDGLIRAFRIEDGRASAEARFVDTPKRRRDAAAGAVVTPGFGTRGRPEAAAIQSADDTNPANTSVLSAGDEVWALWEAGSATRVDPDDLSTRGPVVLRPDLKGMPFLAHPRIEPDGRVWNLGVGGPRAVVWRLSAAGALEAAEMIELPRPSYLHDFTATERHLVIVLQPWLQRRFVTPFAAGLDWEPEKGTEVLVLDKADLTRRRSYELPAFAFFHLDDAWEEPDGTIRFVASVQSSPVLGSEGGAALVAGRDPGFEPPRLARITLGGDGRARLERTDCMAEFPRSDPRRAGRRHRLTAHVTGEVVGRPLARGVATTDLETGRTCTFGFDGDHLTEELLAVPKPGRTEERDAWLIGTSINTLARATELHVFEAGRIADGPVCTWRADHMWPVGFHGAFRAA